MRVAMDRPEPSPLWYIRLVRFATGGQVLAFLVWDFFAHFDNFVRFPGSSPGLLPAYGTTTYEIVASIALGYIAINFILFLLSSALLEVLDRDSRPHDHAGDPPRTDG